MSEIEHLANFQHFDPKTGFAPEIIEGKFVHAAARARALLTQRSGEEIIILADLAEWLMHHHGVHDQMWTQLQESADVIGSPECDVLLSDVALLAKCIDTVCLSDFEAILPKLGWAEVFAARALADIAEAADWLHFHVELRHRDPDHPAILTTLSPYAAEATESVTLAEAYAQIEHRVEQAVQSKISDKNRHAAFRRHNEINALKREFIQFWINDDWPSYAEAARRFLASLPETRRRILAPTNAERTLIQAVSAYIKRPIE